MKKLSNKNIVFALLIFVFLMAGCGNLQVTSGSNQKKTEYVDEKSNDESSKDVKSDVTNDIVSNENRSKLIEILKSYGLYKDYEIKLDSYGDFKKYVLNQENVEFENGKTEAVVVLKSNGIEDEKIFGSKALLISLDDKKILDELDFSKYIPDNTFVSDAKMIRFEEKDKSNSEENKDDESLFFYYEIKEASEKFSSIYVYQLDGGIFDICVNPTSDINGVKVSLMSDEDADKADRTYYGYQKVQNNYQVFNKEIVENFVYKQFKNEVKDENSNKLGSVVVPVFVFDKGEIKEDIKEEYPKQPEDVVKEYLYLSAINRRKKQRYSYGKYEIKEIDDSLEALYPDKQKDVDRHWSFDVLTNTVENIEPMVHFEADRKILDNTKEVKITTTIRKFNYENLEDNDIESINYTLEKKKIIKDYVPEMERWVITKETVVLSGTEDGDGNTERVNG